VAVDEGRSVTGALGEPSARRVDMYMRLANLAKTRKPPNFQRKTQTPTGAPPLPFCARPIGGPRVSLAAWHRLGCLLRGTTRPRLCVCPSCMHLPGAGVPTQSTSHWGHPLGESRVERPGGTCTWVAKTIHNTSKLAMDVIRSMSLCSAKWHPRRRWLDLSLESPAAAAQRPELRALRFPVSGSRQWQQRGQWTADCGLRRTAGVVPHVSCPTAHGGPRVPRTTHHAPRAPAGAWRPAASIWTAR
jgi:hypothetical protein